MTNNLQATSTPIKARDHLSVLLKKMHHGVGPTRVTLTKRQQSAKQQATSNKQQATSNKQQANYVTILILSSPLTSILQRLVVSEIVQAFNFM